MAALKNYCVGPFINDRKANAATVEYVEKISIKTPSINQLAINLSGGNQQRVVLAKWLIKNCDILIFDEPTRGIDVGAKVEIYRLINKLAAEGKAIILLSSSLPEVLGMSDRILVMWRGAITAEFDAREATQEDIMFAATGQARNGRTAGQAEDSGTEAGQAPGGPEGRDGPTAAQDSGTAARGEEPR
jgi:ribose transport system ATP-binding protein